VAVLKRQLEEGGAKSGGGKSDLRERTRDELYEMARDLDVPGRSKMTKDELVAAVKDAEGG
jgi:DNA end-binding protein Ku